MEKNMELTVVVPIYNGADTIAVTLPLLVEQLQSGMELLLIDDGSKDESGMICEKIAESNRAVRYLRQQNTGVAGARNRGIREAWGEYVCFFDQDDYAQLKVYSGLLERMARFGAVMGMCSTSYGTDGNWIAYEQMKDVAFHGQQVLGLVYHLLLNGYDYPFGQKGFFFYGSIWKCVFKRSWLLERKLFFHVYKHYEDDWLFVLESLLQSKGVVCVKDCGYYWRENSRSVSHTRKYQVDFMERARSYEGYLEKLLKDYLPEETYRICLSAVFSNDLIDCMDNVYCAPNAAIRRKERKKVCQLAEERRQDGSLQAAQKLKKNVVRRRVTLNAIEKYGPETGFVIDKVICSMIEIGSSVKEIRRLERKGKHKDI